VIEKCEHTNTSTYELRRVRDEISVVQVIYELAVRLQEVVKLCRLRVGPVAKSNEPHEYSQTPPNLPRSSFFEGCGRPEGVSDTALFIEQVGQNPELVPKNPNEEEEEPTNNYRCHYDN